ncbi:protein of unknown function [Rhodovastum atsumiense]|nr:protein of unknown function [Rhodovastum atsumiense]
MAHMDADRLGMTMMSGKATDSSIHANYCLDLVALLGSFVSDALLPVTGAVPARGTPGMVSVFSDLLPDCGSIMLREARHLPEPWL